MRPTSSARSGGKSADGHEGATALAASLDEMVPLLSKARDEQEAERALVEAGGQSSCRVDGKRRPAGRFDRAALDAVI